MLTLRVPIIVEGKYDKIRIVQVVDAPVITTDGFGIFNKSEKAALIRRLGQNGVILLCDSDGGGTVIRSFLKGILPPEKVYDLYIPQVVGKEKRKRKGGKAGFLGVEGIDNATLTSLFDKLAHRHPEILAMPKEVVSKASTVVSKASTVDNSVSSLDNAFSAGDGLVDASHTDVSTICSGDSERSKKCGDPSQGKSTNSGKFSTGSVSGGSVADRKPISKTDFYLYGLTGGEHAAARRDELCGHLSLPAGMTPNALLAALNILYSREEFLALCETVFPET